MKIGRIERETPAARVRELFDYDNGDLYFRQRPDSDFESLRVANMWRAKALGRKAGGRRNARGYIMVCLSGGQMFAHRIVWAWHHGEWPKGSIDHINGDGRDNRIENLRDVDQFVNMRNCRRKRNNKSGVTGVHFCNERGLWTAQIMVGREHRFLGRFSDLNDAIAARVAAEAGHGFTLRHGLAA